jgi:hypothetical protein
VIDLLRSEWRKVTTIKLGWGMLLGALALAALGVIAQIASNGARGNIALPLSDPATQRSITASAGSAYLFSVVVGIILIAMPGRAALPTARRHAAGSSWQSWSSPQSSGSSTGSHARR